MFSMYQYLRTYLVRGSNVVPGSKKRILRYEEGVDDDDVVSPLNEEIPYEVASQIMYVSGLLQVNWIATLSRN